VNTLWKASLFSIFIFICSLIIIPTIESFWTSTGTPSSFLVSLAFGILCFVILERNAFYSAIVKPVENLIDVADSGMSAYNGLIFSKSFSTFTARARKAAETKQFSALEGYWLALRKDLKQEKLSVYIARIRHNGSEYEYTSYDENVPGETYFVDGVLIPVATQIVTFGLVQESEALHVNALFKPSTQIPSYLFGTHFQTTLSSQSSLSTPVVMIKVHEKELSKNDMTCEFSASEFLEKNKYIAKRHTEAEWDKNKNNISMLCDFENGFNVDNITQFILDGYGSVSVHVDEMLKKTCGNSAGK